MKALLFDIRKYSVHDGPGIRVTFFFKGCPLHCRWCHNPEGISPYPQNIAQTRKVGKHEFVRNEEAGRFYTVKDILKILEEDRVFIDKSQGGVTFSGGEPMLQHEFLLSSLKACRKEGYHTAVDTSGYASADTFRSVIPYTDLFLYDLKHMDDSTHREITGGSNKQILLNFMLLMESGKDVIVRIPVIPGYNDDPGHLYRLREFLTQASSDNLKKICLLPFHKTGASKYKRMNMQYPMEGTEQPSSERMKELKKFFSETGIKVKIGG
ncbi:MAG TPA: glycyl-radical enzyme activating protein [Bacteroidales bacterium]|nr:glycyl-radical enzyme activating protein [Bacteroidales bacterium]